MTWLEKFKTHPQTPNSLSIARGILSLFLPFFILHGTPFAMAVGLAFFLVGAGTDYLDGKLARTYGTGSPLGKILDPTTDKCLILIPLASFAAKGLYSPWWVVLIFIREITVTFLRIAWMMEGRALGAERAGKIKLGMQVSVIIFAFLCSLLSETFLSGFMKLMLAVQLPVAAALTLYSGWTFLRTNFRANQTPGLYKFISACGVGLIPFAPGTWGSALGVLICALTFWNPGLFMVAFAFVFTAGHWAVSRLDLTKQKDPGFVVVDEVVGMMIALWGVGLDLPVYFMAFLLFRGFDIFKPFPCRQAERLPGFWGIMMDDIMAGIYARSVVFLIFRI